MRSQVHGPARENVARASPGEWTGRWMHRGSLGDGTYMGEDRLFLDARAWPLLAGLWDDEQTGILLSNIDEMLVQPSPAGALCLSPPYPAPWFGHQRGHLGGRWTAGNPPLGNPAGKRVNSGQESNGNGRRMP